MKQLTSIDIRAYIKGIKNDKMYIYRNMYFVQDRSNTIRYNKPDIDKSFHNNIHFPEIVKTNLKFINIIHYVNFIYEKYT